jgi:murein endopeptidase
LETAAAVKAAIAGLPPDLRAAVLLTEYAGRTGIDVADEMKMTGGREQRPVGLDVGSAVGFNTVAAGCLAGNDYLDVTGDKFRAARVGEVELKRPDAQGRELG